MHDDAITLLALGDVFLDRPDPDSAFACAAEVFAAADVVFANSEGVYADGAESVPNARPPAIAAAGGAAALGRAGLHVVSVANNHIVDGGYAGVRATLAALRGAGVAPVGAGEDLAAATAPVLLERRGRRIAFVAVSCVFPAGYEARRALPGLAPLRAHNAYVPAMLHDWAPGMVPRVVSLLDDADAERTEAAIAAAREAADVVVVSAHWGDFSRPFVVTDHERECAELFVDAGADVVLGHHQHTLRGVAFCQGRPVFHGLGHWAMDLPGLGAWLAGEGLPAGGPEAAAAFGPHGIYPREDYPLLPFHPDARMTAAAVVRLDGAGRVEVGLVPAVIERSGRTVPVDGASEAGRRVAAYLRECCVRGGTNATVGEWRELAPGVAYLPVEPVGPVEPAGPAGPAA